MAYEGKAVKLGVQRFGSVAIFTAFVNGKLHAVVPSGPPETVETSDESGLLEHILETLAHRVLHLETALEHSRASLTAEKECTATMKSELEVARLEKENMRAELSKKRSELEALQVEVQRLKKAHAESHTEIANLRQSVQAVRHERRANEEEERKKLLDVIDSLKAKNRKLKGGRK